MLRGLAAAVMTIGLVLLPTIAHADDDPAPSTPPLTVVIPDLSVTPTPAPTTPPAAGTGGGRGNGGTITPAPAPAPEPQAIERNEDGSPKPPASPTADKPGLRLDESTVGAGRKVVVSGTGYQPGEKVQLVLYPGAVVIGSYPVGADGSFSVSITVPKDTAAGTHTMEATGWESGTIKNKEFMVTTATEAAAMPVLWWVYVVVGIVVLGLLSGAWFFRATIASLFASPSRRFGAA